MNWQQEIWVASDELGCSDPYDNQKLVSEILRLRQEKAELLGKPDFSEVALPRRMAKCGKNADDFISDLHQKTLPFLRMKIRNWKRLRQKRPAAILASFSLGKLAIGQKSSKKNATISMTKTYVHISPFNQCSMECLTWSQEFLG